MVAPLFVGPFLAYPLDQDQVLSFTTMSPDTTETSTMDGIQDNVTTIGGIQDNFTNSTQIPMSDSYIYIPWGVVGCIHILVSFLYFYIVIKEGGKVFAEKKVKSESENRKKKAEEKQLKTLHHLIVVIVTFFYIIYCTVEMNLGNFLTIFAVKYLGWSKAKGANVTAVFWGSFAFSRGVGIFLIRVLSPTTIIFSDIILALIGFVPVLFFVTYHPAVLWVSSVIIGIAIATIFAAGISWTDIHITVTDSIVSIFMCGAALADFYGPILIVFLMEEVSYMAYIYLLFGCVCILLLLMTVMEVLGKRYVKKKGSITLDEKEVNGVESVPMTSDA